MSSKFLVLIVFSFSIIAEAHTAYMNDFFAQYPKVCKENSQYLILNKKKLAAVAVLKCVDDKYKEIQTCPLVDYCEGGFFEIYTKKENRFELLVKTQQIAEAPKIESKNGIIFLKSEINFASSAKITDKYHFQDGKFKLIGIEYYVRHGGMSRGDESDPTETNFSVNTLTGQIVQTIYFSGHRKKKKKCIMNDKLKNLTITDVPDSGFGNLECP